MPKRGKEPRPPSRHSVGRFSPTQSQRKSRNDYQVAGPSRATSDSSSGRRSPHSQDNIKKSNGNTHRNSSNRKHNMNVGDSPIILTDDDGYTNLDPSMNIFRDNENKMNPGQDPGEGTRIVKHFVPSADRYMSQSAPEKPMFRGPETDVLRDLEKDKLKNIRVQMIRADVQQNESFRQAYVVDDSVANRSKGEKNHQSFDDRQPSHFNSTRMHYDNGDKNYGMKHSLSPSRIISRDQSISPQSNISRPPSPPLPYSPERDHFNSDNMSHRDRLKRSPERKVHGRPPRAEHFTDQHKMDNFSSGPPEPRSPEMQRFRSGDHSRHRERDETIRFEGHSRRSGSPPEYYRHNYPFKSPSPNNQSFSPNHGQLPMSPLSSHGHSPPLRDRQPYSNDRTRRRRSSPPRRDRSRDRRRRVSPRKRTPPPERSPMKRRDNTRKRSNKNQDGRKREAKDRKRRSQSNPNSTSQDQQQQQPSFQQPQPIYPPPPGVVRLPPPPRPFPPGPMMIPLRPPPFPSPMGAWRPRRPPIQAPPQSGWPYPRPRPFYFPY